LFLNLGYKLTATAGSDFPWCGYSRYTKKEGKWDAQIGNVRFYTYVGEDYSFENWKKGFEAGHTFVSNGPMLFLKVNNQLPGSVINLKKGENINISVTAYGQEQQVPLESLQLIEHGKVLDSSTNVKQSGSKEELTLKKTIKAEKGIWIAARVKAAVPFHYAHTTPVYIRVNGEGFHDAEHIQENVDTAESYLDEIVSVVNNEDKTVADNQAWHYKDGLLKRVSQTRHKLEEMRQLGE
jgi:hypothetical protein